MNSEWIEEHCPICYSYNYIRNENINAWSCWNCNSNWWLNNFSKTLYMMLYDLDFEKADQHLLSSHPLIIFGNGQYEKERD